MNRTEPAQTPSHGLRLDRGTGDLGDPAPPEPAWRRTEPPRPVVRDVVPDDAPDTAPERRRNRRLAGPLLRGGVRPLLVAGDLVACLAAFAVGGYRESTLVFAVVFLALLTLGGLHRSRLSLSLLDDLPVLLGRWLAAVAVTLLSQAAFNEVRLDAEVVDWTLVARAGLTGAVALGLRAVSYTVVRRLRRDRRVAHRTLVLGAGQVGAQIAELLATHPEYGLLPVGILDSDPLVAPDRLAVPLVGGTDELQQVLRDEDIRNVVVAFGSQRESTMVELIRTCDRMDCEIFLVPRLFEVHHTFAEMDAVWGLPLVRLRRAAHRSPGWRIKRAVDVTFAGTALVLLSPVLLAVAAAVRLEGGPGVLFRQERIGADGRRFELLKFRSLRPVDETESATRWNVAHDDRLGPVGRVLRTTSVDELPQLLNILRGEMSLVGPRPERPHFVARFQEAYPHYVARHRVPSGLTGWAQVHGLRGDTSIAERARFDNYYIENWSLWLDAKILLRTAATVVRREGG